MTNVLVFLKNLWLREYIKNIQSTPNDLFAYFQGFFLANLFMCMTLWGWFKIWMIIKTGYCCPTKYGNINVIKYYHNGVMYLMPCVLYSKRHISKFVQAFDLKSDSECNIKGKDITNDIKMMLGPLENFGGFNVTPRMLGYSGVCIVYMNDDFEHAEKNFLEHETIRV